jgi:hypothetical protein
MDGALRKSNESSENPNLRTEARMEGKLGPAYSGDLCFSPDSSCYRWSESR